MWEHLPLAAAHQGKQSDPRGAHRLRPEGATRWPSHRGTRAQVLTGPHPAAWSRGPAPRPVAPATHDLLGIRSGTEGGPVPPSLAAPNCGSYFGPRPEPVPLGRRQPERGWGRRPLSCPACSGGCRRCWRGAEAGRPGLGSGSASAAWRLPPCRSHLMDEGGVTSHPHSAGLAETRRGGGSTPPLRLRGVGREVSQGTPRRRAGFSCADSSGLRRQNLREPTPE